MRGVLFMLLIACQPTTVSTDAAATATAAPTPTPMPTPTFTRHPPVTPMECNNGDVRCGYGRGQRCCKRDQFCCPEPGGRWTCNDGGCPSEL
ncbi:MAG TPA: hypothetical protein VH054_01785 [Polyangiaceae bacterium]|nr:hypothetical protein [Polyangiaceae bacterium]